MNVLWFDEIQFNRLRILQILLLIDLVLLIITPTPYLINSNRQTMVASTINTLHLSYSFNLLKSIQLC